MAPRIFIILWKDSSEKRLIFHHRDTEAQRIKKFLSSGLNFHRRFQIPPHNRLSNFIFSVTLRLCGLISTPFFSGLMEDVSKLASQSLAQIMSGAIIYALLRCSFLCGKS